MGDIGPSASAPSPIWSKWLEYPFDFPNGVTYTVGQSRWTTDWNFIQPVVTDSQGNYNPSTSTISFNLASAPAASGQASLYLGFTSDYYAAIIVTVNGTTLTSSGGVIGSPTANVPSTGFYATYGKSDTSIREGNNGAFFDERLTFSSSLLHAGGNTITLSFRETAANYFADHMMYDYLRLELTNYVPPPPAGVTAYPGNHAALVCWPAVPGATSYNLLRSTTSGSGYLSLTNGVTGPVCGSGWNNAVYVDATAANGATYYYVVQSVNSAGSSANSSPSAGATPSAALSATAPAAPTGLAVGGVAHQSVTVTWTAASGANFYTLYRATLLNNGGGASNVLGTIVLANNVTNASYTDTSPTDGSLYSYSVTATSAGGTSANSSALPAVALPAAPASLPVSLVGAFSSTTNITLSWTAVSGAVGYVISRATSSAGPYIFVQSVTETTYTDYGLNTSIIYYYRVAAVNAAGVSAYATDSVNSQQVAPSSLAATATNGQVTLTWGATSNATSYSVKRGTSSGNETTTVISGYAGTTYTNTGLANSTTYYYVVTAAGSGGSSGNSPEASATPYANGSGIWISTVSGAWGAGSNWSGGVIPSGAGSTADFSTLSLPGNLTVVLDSPRTISGLRFGDTSSAYDWTLAGTNTLTLGAGPSINVANRSATLSVPIAGAAGLAKAGLGSLILKGSNSFSGGVSAAGGPLVLDFSASNSPATNIIPATNALTLAGGALRVIGASNAASGQSFASNRLNAGCSVISAAAAGTNVPVVALGAVSATAGGVVELIGPATIGAGNTTVSSNALLTTTAGGNSAFVGGAGSALYNAIFATVGLYDFAAATSSGPPYAIVGGGQIAGFYTSASGTAPASGNLDVIGNITGWSGQPYLTSMRFNTNWGTNIAVALYSVQTLSDILLTPNVGAYNVTFPSNSIRPAGGSSSYAGPLVIWQNNTAGQLILNASLGNSKVAGAAYIQAGPGTVSIITNGSGYSGQTYLHGGVTLIAGSASLGAPATNAVINLNGGTLAANATFAMDNGGALLRPFTLLANGGGLAATAGNTLTVDGVIGGATGAGPLTIGIAASAANSNVAGLLPGSGPGTANAAAYATGTVVLTNANSYTGGTVLKSGTLNVNGINALGGANYGGLTFDGGTLQYAPAFDGNGTGDLTAPSAGITVSAGGGTLDVNGNSVTYSNSFGKNGAGALTVRSSLAGGVLTLMGANTYAGNTTLTNVTLVAGNGNGSATGAGVVVVQNGASLQGAGTLAGSVSVEPGGTLAPGGPFGVLTIGNNVTLAAGSTTLAAIQHSPPACGGLSVGGAFAAGGTLIVTNSGAAAPSAGDSFPLFAASGYSGSFAALTLPALSDGLAWDTNALNSTGVLTVVVTRSPAIGTVSVSGGSLTLTGSNGVGSAKFCLLSSTNLLTPLANWTRELTNEFDADGRFSVTNTLPAAPRKFYRLQLQ